MNIKIRLLLSMLLYNYVNMFNFYIFYILVCDIVWYIFFTGISVCIYIVV